MKIFRILPLTALALLMISCSTVKVVVDENKSTDFSKYLTYSFLGWQNHSDQDLSAEDKGYLRDAFTNEFERRGLTRANSGGDMQISLYIVTNKETSVSGYNDYVGNRGYNHYYGYGTGNMNNTFTQASKEVGTLIMNVYDRESHDQIWHVIATATVQKNPSRRKSSIPSKISIIMRDFPVKPK